MQRLKLLILTITLAHGSIALAEPDWLYEHQNEDAHYKYYVGRSTIDEDESKSFENATTDAYKQAIKENYGVYTSYESDYYNTLNDKALILRNREQSKRVFLKDFEQIDSYVSKRNNKKYLYLKFKYSKKAILIEKLRLNKLKTSTERLSTIGDVSKSHDTILQIETSPAGAEVYLNNQRWGVTPVVLRGLPVGKYTILLDHMKFNSIREEILISSGAKVSVKKTLTPAKSYFEIDSTPSKAKAYINGKFIGMTPLYNVSLLSHQSYELKLVHKFTETVQRTVRGLKDQKQSIQVDLPYKQTQFSINSNPTGASIYIDGEYVGMTTKTPPEIVAVEVGRHIIALKKDGFLEKEIVFSFMPNEQKHFGIIELEAEPKREPSSPQKNLSINNLLDHQRSEHSYRWKPSLFVETSSPTNNLLKNSGYYSLGFSMEYRPFGHLGTFASASLDYGFSSSDYENGSTSGYDISGYGIKYGLPVYFSSADDSYFVAWEAGYITHTYEQGLNFSYVLNQRRNGISFGKSEASRNFEWKLTYFQYEMPNNKKFESITGGFYFVFP
ncbi:MAG: PEGA domain-containing protein [Bdellovibrionales bacterium]|nr:PEGA domain-containing protein [Bdellovibrionales bacterium]